MNKENLSTFLEEEIEKNQKMLLLTEALVRQLSTENLVNPSDAIRKAHLENIKRKDFIIGSLKQLSQLTEEVRDGRYTV